MERLDQGHLQEHPESYKELFERLTLSDTIRNLYKTMSLAKRSWTKAEKRESQKELLKKETERGQGKTN